jgi:lipid-A-disaccharide synthase-like uncharacterized protein
MSSFFLNSGESFWYFSLVGAAGLLAYSIYRSDPVFIIGLSFSFVVYLRNLYFINKKKKRALP